MARLSSELERAQIHERFSTTPRVPRRAVAFGGGGPAVGISVGFLMALDEWNAAHKTDKRGIEFPVWIAGCVGGWLTCLYHLSKAPKADNVKRQIGTFFRDKDGYENFPAPTTFTPDIPEMIAVALKFFVTPANYPALVVPADILRGYSDILKYFLAPAKWNHGDFCYLMLNSVLAPNPAVRLLMSLLYKTELPGINRLWFDSAYSLLKGIDIPALGNGKTPDIYINSYEIASHESHIYCNHSKTAPFATRPLTIEALCASSALPYILSPVEVNGEKHIEGALVDSFCFEAIHQNHEDLTEIWVSQIVDHTQVKEPHNLLEALNNLIMLYAGTTSRHDIEIFVNQLNHDEIMRSLDDPKGSPPELIECIRLPVDKDTGYFWSASNFEASVTNAKAQCAQCIVDYDKRRDANGMRVPDAKNLFVRASQFKGD